MSEEYPKEWKHCTIHLNPQTGEIHSDGDHSVREWIQSRLESAEKERIGLQAKVDELKVYKSLAGQMEIQRDSWKAIAENLQKAASNIEDMVTVPERLGYESSRIALKAIDNFKDALKYFDEEVKKG